MTKKPDAQQIGIVGLNLLVSLLVADDFEVAVPIRDRGTDLIIFNDTYRGQRFRAAPVQLKSFSDSAFSLNEAKQKDMLMAYVWYTARPRDAEVYIMRFDQAVALVHQSGYFEKHRNVFIPKPSKQLVDDIQKYKYSPHRLSEMLDALQ